MPKEKFPVTPAVRALRAAGISFEPHLYAYEEKGGTEASARELCVDEHCVIKTLILEDEGKRPLVALMHGDFEVSTKNLARLTGAKTIVPCAPPVANRHSGYIVGGTSPFGLKRSMPLYAQVTIADLPKMYINGGKRGFLVALNPAEALAHLGATLLEIRASPT